MPVLLPPFELVPTVLLFVASIGLVTLLLGAASALLITDIKRVLAYSTISHPVSLQLSVFSHQGTSN